MRSALLAAAAAAAAALVIPDGAEACAQRGRGCGKSDSRVSAHKSGAYSGKAGDGDGAAYGGGIACTSSTPPGTPGCSLARPGRRPR